MWWYVAKYEHNHISYTFGIIIYWIYSNVREKTNKIEWKNLRVQFNVAADALETTIKCDKNTFRTIVAAAETTLTTMSGEMSIPFHVHEKNINEHVYLIELILFSVSRKIDFISNVL